MSNSSTIKKRPLDGYPTKVNTVNTSKIVRNSLIFKSSAWSCKVLFWFQARFSTSLSQNQMTKKKHTKPQSFVILSSIWHIHTKKTKTYVIKRCRKKQICLIYNKYACFWFYSSKKTNLYCRKCINFQIFPMFYSYNLWIHPVFSQCFVFLYYIKQIRMFLVL